MFNENNSNLNSQFNSQSGNQTFRTSFSSSNNQMSSSFDGYEVLKGEDGISPVLDVIQTDTGYRVSITDKNGVQYFDINNGKNGVDGTNGKTPIFKMENGVLYVAYDTPDSWMILGYIKGDTGINGLTPYIKNNTWWIGNEDTSIVAIGKDGENGKNGKGIKSVKSNSDYSLTIYFDDNTSYTTEPIRGEKGRDGYTPIKGVDYFDGKDGYTPIKGKDYFDGKDGKEGKQGEKGQDGYTPIKGKDYFDGKDGKDGYTPIKGVDYFDGVDGRTPIKGIDYFDGKNGQDGKDGYTPRKGIDYFDGVDGRDGINGKDGYTPVKNIDYFDGKDGKDGYTPIKNIDYFDGKDGKDGKDGLNGKDGYTPQKGVDYFDGEKGRDGYTPVKGKDYFDGKDGYTPIKGVDYFDGKDGRDGKDGINGQDGYTPIKGVDYFDGVDGKNGYTPVKGIDYFDGKDGKNGRDGTDGRNGIDGKDGHNGRDGKDGYTPVKYVDYFDGKDGEKGADGYTPIKGVDYFDGVDGDTPYIGENGNWWIGENDTGVSASGEGGSIDLPLSKGTGENSIVIAEGEAIGDNSIAGGTTDLNVIESVLGEGYADLIEKYGAVANMPDSIINLILNAADVGYTAAEFKRIATVSPSVAEALLSISLGASNKSKTAASISLGYGNMAGAKGYYITDTNTSKKTITLSIQQSSTVVPSSIDWSIGDRLFIVNDDRYWVEIANKNGNVITLVDMPFSSLAPLKTVSIPLGDTYDITNPTERSVINIDKPESGAVDIGWGAIAIGSLNQVLASCGYGVGFKNIIAGEFGAAFGQENEVGYSAFSAGIGNVSKGKASVSLGNQTEAIGRYSFAKNEGTRSEGKGSNSQGYRSKAIGDYSDATGYLTTTLGKYSSSAGESSNRFTDAGVNGGSTVDEILKAWEKIKFSLAKGQGSHVDGLDCLALADYADAGGECTRATGNCSTSRGVWTLAKGKHSYAGGDSSKALHWDSFVHGKNLETTADNQAVVGRNNARNQQALFIVGNGSSAAETDRNNAFEVLQNGTAILGGKEVLTVEGIGDLEASLDHILSIQEELALPIWEGGSY